MSVGEQTFADRLRITGDRAFAALEASGRLRADATPPRLELPPAFAAVLLDAVELERRDPAPGGSCEQTLLEHYLDRMPSLLVEQLCAETPWSWLFHEPLPWERLPRLRGAVDDLFCLLARHDVDPVPALGARDAETFRSTHPTLAAIHVADHYGGFMPLLYGQSQDLATFAAEAEAEGDRWAAFDRRLAAPVLHELCHFARDRRSGLPLYLDEVVAGYLGVHLLPDLAYPEPGADNALFAAPWFAQVGQAVMRVAGERGFVRAQAGAEPWAAVLPGGLFERLVALGVEVQERTRSVHFLGETTRPEPWIKACYLARAGLAHEIGSMHDLDALPWAHIPTPQPAPLDLVTLEHALYAMCLRPFLVDGSFRVELRPFPVEVRTDLEACTVSGSMDPDGHGPAPPRYLFPPALAARAGGPRRIELRLEDHSSIATTARAWRDGDTQAK